MFLLLKVQQKEKVKEISLPYTENLKLQAKISLWATSEEFNLSIQMP